MNTKALVAAFAALLGSSLVAQVIQINRVGWTVIPSSQLLSDVFAIPGPNPPYEYVSVDKRAEVSTSETYGSFYAAATWIGISTTGPAITSGGQPLTAMATETYTRTTGAGNVLATFTAQPDPTSGAIYNLTYYRALASASVSVGGPGMSPVDAGCVTQGTYPHVPILMTLPQTGSVSLTGQNSWYVAMTATAQCTGTVWGLSYLQLGAACFASGIVTLN